MTPFPLGARRHSFVSVVSLALRSQIHWNLSGEKTLLGNENDCDLHISRNSTIYSKGGGSFWFRFGWNIRKQRGFESRLVKNGSFGCWDGSDFSFDTMSFIVRYWRNLKLRRSWSLTTQELFLKIFHIELLWNCSGITLESLRRLKNAGNLPPSFPLLPPPPTLFAVSLRSSLSISRRENETTSLGKKHPARGCIPAQGRMAACSRIHFSTGFPQTLPET